jgi:shikimate kinase
MAKTPIVITGFMATGKSTVAPIVAHKLGWSVFETDAEIVRRAGKSIPQLFAQHGEASFRELERTLCYEIPQLQHIVVSTGGGMLIDDVSRRLLVRNAFVVCLTAPESVIAERLADTSGRPVAAEWQTRYHERLPKYNEIPNQIDTTGKAPDAIAQEVISLWNASP